MKCMGVLLFACDRKWGERHNRDNQEILRWLDDFVGLTCFLNVLLVEMAIRSRNLMTLIAEGVEKALLWPTKRRNELNSGVFQS